MTTIAIPLLNENFGTGPGIQLGSGGGVGLVLPSNAVDFGEFGDAVTFVMSLSAVGGSMLAAVAGSASADTFTYTAHGLANGTVVEVHANSLGQALPGGVTEGGRYFVVNTAANTFKLSLTSGGSAIDLTADGTAAVFYDIPTTFKVGAKFQILQPHTQGGMFQKRRWADLGHYNIAGMVTEGVGFGTAAHAAPDDGGFGYIADQTDVLSTPITVARTIRDFGHGVRLALDLSVTGGTTPRVCLSVVALVHVKGS